MKILLRFFSAFVSALIVIGLIYCLILGADGINSITGWDLNNCLYEGFKFSLSEHFIYILIAALIIVTLLSLIFFKADRFIIHLKGGMRCVKENFVATWNAIWQTKLKYILPIPLIAYIYFATTLPITHDEATTYTYYISNSLFGTMALYTMPNNHILFSLIAKPFVAIGIFDLLLAVRLPAMLISMLTWPTLFRFVRKYYSENTALIVTAISSMGLMVMVYSIFSRGYSIILLTTIVCLYAAYNIINEGNRVRHWAIFTIGSIVGFYAIPTFLYPYIAINLFILIYNYKQIGKQIYYNLLAAGLTYLLYMPVFIIMGLEAITDNGFVKPLEMATLIERIYPFIIDIVTSLYGIAYYIVIPVLVLVIVYSITQKDKRTAILWCLFLIIPFIMIFAQSVIPFTRTFCYLGIVIILLIGITFNNQLKKISSKVILIIALFVQFAGLAQFSYYSSFTVMMAASFEDFMKDYLKEGKSYAYKYDFAEPIIKFEIERQELKDIILEPITTDSVNADSINGYDYVIIDRERDVTKLKQPTDTLPYGYQHRMLHIYTKE